MNALLFFYFFAGVRGGAAVADVLVDATGAGQAFKPSSSAVGHYRRELRRLIVRKGESVGLVVIESHGVGQKHGSGAELNVVSALPPAMAGMAGRAGAGTSAVSTRAVGAGVGVHPPAVVPVLAMVPAGRRHDDRRRALIDAAVAASVSGAAVRRPPARHELDDEAALAALLSEAA